MSELSSKKTENLIRSLIDPNIKGIFRDDYWLPVRKIETALLKAEINYSLINNNYYHSKDGAIEGKIWHYTIHFLDRGGWHLKLITSFGPSTVDQKTNTHKADAYDLIYTLSWDGKIKIGGELE